jgi:hypothetical protein
LYAHLLFYDVFKIGKDVNNDIKKKESKKAGKKYTED